MFRSEINGHHENQDICLKIFPPQVTAGESAVAQLEPVGPPRPTTQRGGSPWELFYGTTQLGTSLSHSTGISIRFDKPGRKRLLAAGRLGTREAVLAYADLVVHGHLDHEVDAIVESLDEFGAWVWFQSILDRHGDDPDYIETLDLSLSRHLTGPSESARKTAFSLLGRMHERGMRRTAARFLKRDEHAIEDVIQEAKSRAWRSIGRFDPGRRFGPWIHKALINACKDEKKGVRIASRVVDREALSYDEAIATIDARHDLEWLMRGFTRGDVEMLTLRHGHDQSYIDIARILKIQLDRPDQTRISTVRRQVEKLELDLRAAQGAPGDTRDTGGIA